jgi:hypothetical protein
VHAERLVHKLIPINDHQRADQARVRGEIQDLYTELKADRRNPDPALRPTLEERFDAIFTQRTSYTTLKRLHTHKSELLRVLERPDLVLHTNGSEGDIRSFVKWRNRVSRLAPPIPTCCGHLSLPCITAASVTGSVTTDCSRRGGGGRRVRSSARYADWLAGLTPTSCDRRR